MAETSESTKIIDELQSISLLPRSAWNNKLTYFKVLLKAKQSLDKNEKLYREWYSVKTQPKG